MLIHGSPFVCEALLGSDRATLVSASRLSRLHLAEGHRVFVAFGFSQ
jgi:hypothetical protein